MGGMGGWGGEETEVEKNWQFRKPFPTRFLCRKEKKKLKKNVQKKSRTQIISPVNLAGDIIYLLSLVFIKTRFEKSLCFTMDSFSRVRDGIVTHSAKCLEPQ